MDVDFSTEPIPAGTTRPMRVVGQAPISISIECFVTPPGSLQPCPECGSFQVASGSVFLIRASSTRFGQGGGSILIHVEDASGDSADFEIEVVHWGDPGSEPHPSKPKVASPGGASASQERELRFMGR